MQFIHVAEDPVVFLHKLNKRFFMFLQKKCQNLRRVLPKNIINEANNLSTNKVIKKTEPLKNKNNTTDTAVDTNK